MSGPGAFLGAFLAAAAGSLLVGAAIRLPPGLPFPALMRRRGLRMAGRTAVVLGVIAAMAGPGHAPPLATAGGALLGWLLAAGREARSRLRAEGGDGA